MRRIVGAIVSGLLQTAVARAQGLDTLPLLIPPMDRVTSPSTAALSASHRSAETRVDQPVR